MLARLTVRAGMLGVLAIFIVSLCIATSIIWFNARTADAGFQRLYNATVLQIEPLHAIHADLLENRMQILGAHRDILAKNQQGARNYADKADQTIQRAEATLRQVLTVPKSEAAQRLITAIQQHMQSYAPLMRQSAAALREGSLDAYTSSIRNERSRHVVELDRLLGEYFTLARNLSETMVSEAHDRRSLANLASVALLALALLLAVGFWLYISRQLLRPLDQAGEALARVAEGDLTQRVEVNSRNEIGRLFAAVRRMQESLTRMVAQVRTGVDEINVGASEIAQGNTELSGRTEQQAASLEETAASMEELAATVKQNADNAQQANQLTVNSMNVAQQGGSTVNDVVATMREISTSSRKISEIVGVIDSIAFQTNILALNAAVESARAGEQGKGFAVVASEVRSLAQRSAQAAREIKTLIEESVEKVDTGSQQAELAGSTMNDIVNAVRRVTDIMGEITAATQEQSGGIDQINTAVRQMDDVTQQNAALVQEAASAAGSLEDQARHLQQAVAVFRINARDVIDMPRLDAQALT